MDAKTQIFGNYSSESMKMMQAMGWKGGGLGADGEGMREPLLIKHRFDNDKRGLGLPVGKKKKKNPQTKGSVINTINTSKQSRRQLLLLNEEDEDSRKKKGRKMSEIFEENFCPDAWTNFWLDHDEVLAAVVGLPKI